ncbi:glutathione S-transferase C-terminal domain-containing protein homolog [Oratosquilla oratoria]|uniref:glutathione S-transferase C-terminal domain-containing protein homolog n=1 Tax=Oratosquilla oratoria TaxID=337810 RepID=UPI003F77225A
MDGDMPGKSRSEPDMDEIHPGVIDIAQQPEEPRKEYAHLFLEGYEEGNDAMSVTAASLVSLFVVEYCKNAAVQVFVVNRGETRGVDDNKKKMLFPVCNSRLSFPVKFLDCSATPMEIRNCELPAVLTPGENWTVVGLCSSLRFVIQRTVEVFPGHDCEFLLGFRKGCLQACAEVSVWTKFCEVEIIRTLARVYEMGGLENGEARVPEDILRLEHHFRHPPILHNALKRKQEHIRRTVVSKEEREDLIRKKLKDLPELEHNYAEGLDMTLADVILFVCVHLIVATLRPFVDLEFNCPLVHKWWVLIAGLEKTKSAVLVIADALQTLSVCHEEVDGEVRVVIPEIPPDSLYKSDPDRYKSRWRMYTNQSDIERVVNLVLPEFPNLAYNPHPRLGHLSLDWKALPAAVNPEEGQLPVSRLERKCQQIENIVSAVLAVAKDGDVIVDFCAGGGHVGIVVAYVLPACTVLMVENKEASLNRAKERVQKLGLCNVQFYQCNLDYFRGKFDVGVCLHACGVATDLVLQKCYDSSAAFVCCPCCYGSIRPNHMLQYPRSAVLRQVSLSLDDFLILGHAADQTHGPDNPKTEQGHTCMRIVDADRLKQAKEFGFSTSLVLMDPPSCSPKNHLLIGVPSKSSALL